MTDMPLNTYIEWTDADRKIGKCPVPDGSDVTVWFRGGTTDRDCEPQSWFWGGPAEDYITGYLVHSMPREPVVVWVVVNPNGRAARISQGDEIYIYATDKRKNAEEKATMYGGRVVKLVEVDDD